MAKPQTATYQTKGVQFPLNPEVIVQLSGTDGNALSIIGAVRQAMRRANLPEEAINAFSAKNPRLSITIMLFKPPCGRSRSSKATMRHCDSLTPRNVGLWHC